MKASRIAALGALFAVLALGLAAGAHEFRPGLLDVTAIGDGRFEVVWTPAPGGERVTPVFPDHCVHLGRARVLDDRHFVIDCGARGLAGQRISVQDMAPVRDEVLVRLHLADGAEVSAMLHAERPAFDVPEARGAESAPVARSTGEAIVSYAFAGAAHLVTGPDHVLFLIGLLLLVRRTAARHGGTARPLFFAVTAFTIAHSLSLALQVLGAVKLPPAPVEAAIALSVLLLARELLRGPVHDGASGRASAPSAPNPGDSTLAQRRPYVVTFAFGLLHGLGFAGGLTSLRVPRAEIPAALFGFNVGLEIAQLALVLAALAAIRAGAVAVRRAPRFSPARWPVWTRHLPAYALGAVAAFWVIERTAAF